MAVQYEAGIIRNRERGDGFIALLMEYASAPEDGFKGRAGMSSQQHTLPAGPSRKLLQLEPGQYLPSRSYATYPCL